MSVYTTVSRQALIDFLADYDVGSLIGFEGISDGIDNTNYFVDTSAGRFVLTLFEHYEEPELEFFLDLVALLAEADLPCAHPLACAEGRYLRRLNGKPAALVACLPGRAVELPSIVQCAAVGEALGHIHLAAFAHPGCHADKYGPDWFERTAQAVLPQLPEQERALMTQELDRSLRHRHSSLPCGIIHADLFRDNALFEGERLTGVIDFYTACNGMLLYDLAICVNDWCVLPSGALDLTRGRAFTEAYHAVRPLREVERDAWPDLLRLAALRFWLSRLHDKHFPREGDVTHVKDPDRFRDILRLRSRNPAAADTLWPVDRIPLREAR